jgi:toxin ParE1/3/4
MIEREWRVRLGAVAKLDLASILGWTTENFGARQARIYRDTIVRTITELQKGPDLPGSRLRNEIGRDVRIVHVAGGGRRGRHFLLYKVVQPGVIEVARILHDSMDLRRHMPTSSEDG